MRIVNVICVLGLGFITIGCSPTAPVLKPNGLAQTPPMGWNSWSAFAGGISDTLLRQTADALVTTGMRDLGYRYINIDDGWALLDRVNGHIQPDPTKFPQGIKALTDYLHAKGLKFGIYIDRGSKTCVAESPGSHGYETIDAEDFAAWGVDYVKDDNCNPTSYFGQEEDYQRMREAMDATGRPMVFSICAWEFKDWMPRIGNLWRTTRDMRDDWRTIVNIIDTNEKSAQWAGPGRWNDPDMLVVGCYGIPDLQNNPLLRGASELVGSKGLTETENRAHFSMWAIMAAPLIASNDVREMPEYVREILTNREVIAVDQDPLGRQGIKVWDSGNGLQVYSKVLTGQNTRAVALFNRTEDSKKITAKWKDIGIPEGSAAVRNLWEHSNLGNFEGSYTAYVGPHEVVLLKITALNQR